jgi:hypothetical protein
VRFRGFRVEHLRHVGWRAYRVESYVTWCGHGQGGDPVPAARRPGRARAGAWGGALIAVHHLMVGSVVFANEETILSIRRHAVRRARCDAPAPLPRWHDPPDPVRDPRGAQRAGARAGGPRVAGR